MRAYRRIPNSERHSSIIFSTIRILSLIHIYQVLGLSGRDLRRALLMEDGVYLLCAALLGLVILIAFCYFVGWNDYFLIYLPLWCLTASVFMAGGLILQRILVSRLFKEDLGQTIAYTE